VFVVGLTVVDIAGEVVVVVERVVVVSLVMINEALVVVAT